MVGNEHAGNGALNQLPTLVANSGTRPINSPVPRLIRSNQLQSLAEMTIPPESQGSILQSPSQEDQVSQDSGQGNKLVSPTQISFLIQCSATTDLLLILSTQFWDLRQGLPNNGFCDICIEYQKQHPDCSSRQRASSDAPIQLGDSFQHLHFVPSRGNARNGEGLNNLPTD